MHRAILGFGLLALCGGASAGVGGPSNCPASAAAPIERFIAADCLACWQAADAPATEQERFRLDWIIAGRDDAPLAALALPEAAERRERAAGVRLQPPASRRLARGATLAVSAGPAWYGYFGVQADIRGRWPPGSRAWLALVETLDAGTPDNPSPRTLVRALAGPLPLPGPHLHALRLPAAAAIEHLQPRVWIEAADGRILALASPACPLE